MSATPPPNQALADLSALLGAENVRSLLRTFLIECPRLVGEMPGADRRTRERIVHNLKSNARIVGAIELSQRLAGLELRLREPAEPDLSAAEIAAVAADFEQLSASLRPFAATA